MDIVKRHEGLSFMLHSFCVFKWKTVLFIDLLSCIMNNYLSSLHLVDFTDSKSL